MKRRAKLWRVELDAVEPMELMRHETPRGVWMRFHDERHVTVELIGSDRDAMLAFIEAQWGPEQDVAPAELRILTAA